MVLYLISGGVLTALHFDHYLYRFAGVPAAPYSDMNGWGHFAAPVFWFNLYWTFAAGVLVCLTYAGWVRGHESRLAAAVAIRARAAARARALGGAAPARGLRRDRRLHLLQHERPQRVRAVGRSGTAAGGVREEVPSIPGRAAAARDVGAGRRRHHSSRAPRGRFAAPIAWPTGRWRPSPRFTSACRPA